jgi:protein TonB
MLDMRTEAMAGYRAAADQTDKAKALTGVALVHAALAVLLLSGLTVHTASRAVQDLKTFDINLPPPKPPPLQNVSHAKASAGAPGQKARSSPIVAAKASILLPIQQPMIAARVAGVGSAARSGEGVAGLGSGTGGSGSGSGNGGSAEAHWLSGGLYDSDNRGGRFSGVVGVRFTVLASGRIDGCWVSRPSGDQALDGLTCILLTQRLRFNPARDLYGRPIESDMGTTFTWGVRPRSF